MNLFNLGAYLAGIISALSILLGFLLALLIPFTIGVSVLLLPFAFLMWGVAVLLARLVYPDPRLSSSGTKMAIFAQSGLHFLLNQTRRPVLWCAVILLMDMFLIVGMYFLFRKN